MAKKRHVVDKATEAEEQGEQVFVDATFRPQYLNDFIGQAQGKRQLRLAIDAAKGRGEMPDHLLFSGPPGLGKTTLAGIVASELGAAFRQSSAPAIKIAGDLAALLMAVEPGSVLFIDEIHRLSPASSEVLYIAMEDFALDLTIGENVTAKTHRIKLAPFTFIGATTQPGSLPAPLLDRFGIPVHLDYYSEEEILGILQRDADAMQLDVRKGALESLAGRARGTPRIAKKLLRRVRDWAETQCAGEVTQDGVSDCLAMLGIDALGLDGQDRRYLDYLIRQMRGRPVGLGTISAALTEDQDTLEYVVEPYLLKVGLLQRTPRGRVASALAYERYGTRSAA